jgi:predicted dehydrogenase
MKNKTFSRRQFLETALKTTAAISVPTIVPASVFGKNAPSNRINVAAIGAGRISRDHDMVGTWNYDMAQLMAVCDVDERRLNEGKDHINAHYTKKTGKPYNGVKMYSDYRELLQNKDIDAVLISTPDHWHAKIAVDAARAKKHIYLQKPTSLTISEGRILSDVVQKSGVVFQIGSQQRSSPQFRYAAELVRNGRIGRLKNVYIGLPYDPSGDVEKEMPIPKGFNYDMWLGSTPSVFYTEKRVHPQVGYDRPGWLRCEQFGAGMITGWGSHHIDSAHWGMGTELTGPLEIWGEAQFPKSGMWDVHGSFKTHAMYADGSVMTISDGFPNGVKFEGTEGWIFVTRGAYRATPSDPIPVSNGVKSLDASDPKILTSVIGDNETKLMVSKEHHANWLDSIRGLAKPIAPVEVAHRSCSACLLHHIAMKLGRHVYWNPEKEQFKFDDKEATALLSRPQRAGYEVK